MENHQIAADGRNFNPYVCRVYVVTVIGFSLWTAYGILLMQWPLILTDSICLLFSGFILVMKLLPPRKRNEVADKLDPQS